MAMRPDFALNLSLDGITLLQRVKGGWAELGQAALDGDLEAEMAALRARAAEAGQADGAVKLILPEDQIKLLERDMPPGVALDAAARDALEGQTPYAVDELRIDAMERDGRLHVAAVARETLEEAEAFALEHGFAPMGFVAARGNGFGREVCFGAADSWSGKPLKPEAAPIRIVPLPEPEAAPTSAPDAQTAPDAEAEPDAPPAEGASEAEEGETAGDAAETPEPAPSTHTDTDIDINIEHTEPRAEAETETENAAPAVPETPAPPQTPPPYPVRARAPDPLAAAAPTITAERPRQNAGSDEVGEDAPAFVSMRARRDAPPAPKKPAAALRAPDRSASPAPRLSVKPAAADRIDNPVLPDPGLIGSLTRPPEPPETPESRTSPTPRVPPRLSDRETATPGPFARPDPKTAAEAEPERGIGKAAFSASQIPSAGGAPGPSVTAPAGPAIDSPGLAAMTTGLGAAGLRPGAAADPDDDGADTRGGFAQRLGLRRNATPASPAKIAPGAASATGAATEAERMTVFGARRKDNYVGGKPRFLGLMLTSALLIFLLGVAAWASVFLEDGIARFFRSAPPTEIARVPDDPLPEVAAPAPAAPEPVQEARLAPEPPVTAPAEPDAPAAAPALAAPTPPAAPAEPSVLSTEEAEATYAATGIWQLAPEPPVDIRESDAGDLYVASIDPDVPQFDANALPMAEIARDPAYAAPPIPAPAGTVFDLDARGLVRATPEGAVNPDRVRIFAGLPPAVPPLRGDALAPVLDAIPEREDGTRPAPTEIFQRLQEIDDFRPNARPGDLQEQNDRANLTGFSRSELAAFRPALRPDVEKAAEEADVTATAQAVAVSERPSPRPVNMARIIAEAQARQQAAPEPAPTRQVAAAATAAAPRTVAPSIPSNTSVSRAATEENAINLRSINLIGVYGQPSSRSALVRLSNGRYVKVSVGDRLDGGRVSAIGDDQLRYVKGGRNVTLQMPRG
ncbi:hypothetical protein SAMN05421759_10965 [Roseivivax lentus]|uniref:Type IV pilus biogenesis protein PilP n=1 Tax=Roseivivax lentus TaxID=633194 RepID=A0A1N7NNT7_9RHOB|nr:hypothetical protein [Roseivivax lentus]SIS99967.1 hypothetical protein SAMN05421759_10965 [Roseivivax lentus]